MGKIENVGNLGNILQSEYANTAAKDPEISLRGQKARINLAKANQSKAAKADAEKTYGEENVAKVEWAKIPDPPPGLLPDDPVYRTVWAQLVKTAQADPQLALSLVNNTKLREQAESEAALAQREATAIPEYLRELVPIIAVAVERHDSTLATIVHRGDNGLPMSDMEAMVYRWCSNRRAGHDHTSGRDADAIAEYMNERPEEYGTQPTGNSAIPVESGEPESGEIATPDVGISGGLPESTGSGEERGREMGGLSPEVPLPENVPPLAKPESQEKIPEPENISDILPPIQESEQVSKSPVRAPKRRKK